MQAQAERTGEEVSPATIYTLFESEYLDRADDTGPDAFRFDTRGVAETASPKGAVAFTASVSRGGDQRRLACAGTAPAAALVAALHAETGLDVFVSHESADPLRAPDEGFVAYVELTAAVSSPVFGVGRGPSVLVATVVATSRALKSRELRASCGDLAAESASSEPGLPWRGQPRIRLRLIRGGFART